jgi:amino acid adenylation domain-containing protein
VATTPDAVAVADDSAEVTYAELDAHAERLAGRLRAAGVRPGDAVGLLAERTPAMVAATLGILKAGAAYLPIDVGYPPERVAFCLADGGATALVTDAGRAAGFPGPTLLADATGPAVAELASAGPAGAATDTAYVMYTSGTTGRPKGVQVCHRGVVRLVRGTDYLTFGPDTRMLAISSICFDAATFELWAPLLNGGRVQLAGPDVALDAAALGRALTSRAITTMLLISPVFNHLVEQDPATFRPLRHLMVGGDALSAHHLGAVMDACPDLVLLNGYGPTENTTLATTHRLSRGDLERIPIGRPVANSTAYVLDPDGGLCPIGVPGELCVGGDGVAHGYLGRPELTAAAFKPDPYRPGGLMFRTGDIARWQAGGVLEFFGRHDKQVKVRGFRIELGEVEHALRDHDAVREAVVVARPRPVGTDRYLVAYHVADRDVPVAELRAYLGGRLPGHMVPAVFVRVPAMPLNSSNKIDMDRLPVPSHPPAPDPDAAGGGGDPTGATLTRLVRAALGHGPGSLDDDLRDLGADSFTGAVLSTAIATEFGVRVPPGEVLRAGTVRRLAERVHAAAPAGPPMVTRAPDAPDHPVSPQQRRLYIEQAKHPGAVHYNVPVLVELPVEVDAGRLGAALGQLAERHEALRTEFVLRAGEVRQRIAPAVTPPLTVVVGDPAGSGAVPFDLAHAPLWRVTAGRAGGRTVLRLDLHHIVVDGVSLAILARDLTTLCAGGDLPPPPALRYRDYASFLDGPNGTAWRQAQGAYWRAVFPVPRRQPDLPLDEPRPPMRALDGGEVAFGVGARRTAGLRDLARRRDTTLFTVLAAGYAAVLSQLTGDPDVTIGTPMSGRTVPGVKDIAGIFATTVCLRVAARPEQTFNDLVREFARATEEAAAHQDYPLEDLAAEVEPGRDYRRQPLFDALIAVHSARYLNVESGGHRTALRPQWNGQTPFDLNMQVFEEPPELRVSLQYGARILRRSTVEGWRDRLLDLLDAAVADPSTQVGTLTAALRPEPDLEFDL